MIDLQQKVMDHSPTKDYTTVDFANDIDSNFQELLGGLLMKNQTDALSIPIPADSIIEKVLITKVSGTPTAAITYIKSGDADLPIIPSDLVGLYTISPVVNIYSNIAATLHADVSGGTVNIKIYLITNCTS
jgi:hypothetical protein